MSFGFIPQLQDKDVSKAQTRAKERSKHLLKCLSSHITEPFGIYIDLGCGNAEITAQIAIDVNAKTVYGLDIYHETLFRQPSWSQSQTQIHYLRNEQGKCYSGLKHFADNSVDLITGFELIHHIIDPNDLHILLSDIHRVLKPNGFFFFREHDVDIKTQQGQQLADFITTYHDQFDDWIKDTPIVYHSRIELQKLLQSYKFKFVANSFYPFTSNPQAIYHSLYKK